MWCCYFIASLHNNQTYIGATDNFVKRLNKHNTGKGAKKTRGQTWIPYVIISGFHHKNACLSFESGWKRLAKTRSNKKLDGINLMTSQRLSYIGSDTRWNRILDLLFFLYTVTLEGTKYRMNYFNTAPPQQLIINIYAEDIVSVLPWPYYVSCNDIIF